MSSQPDEPQDLRLVPTATALWVGCWVGSVPPPPGAGSSGGGLIVPIGIVVGLASLLGLARAGRRPQLRVQWALALVALGAGLLLGWTRVAAAGLGPVPALAAERAVVDVELVTTGDARLLPAHVQGDVLLPPRRLIPARVEVVDGRGAVSRVRTPVAILSADPGWDPLLPGTRLQVTGRLQLAADGEVMLVVDRPPPAPTAGPPWWQRAAGAVRAGLQATAGGPSPDGAALLPGLVVGDTSAMSDELVEDLRQTGLTHLTAVSGGNVAVVVGAALWVARGVGIRGRWLVVIAAATLGSFLVVTRAEPSVLRASVMAGVGLLAVATGRARRSLPALAGAVVVLLAVDPGLARSYGFALSVLATAGLILWAGPWGMAAAHRLGRLGLPDPPARLLGYAVAVPLAAQVAVAPVLVLLNPTVSVVSVPANVLVAPAVAPATVLGLLAGLVQLIHPPLAGVLGWLGGVPASWITLVGRAGADLPAGQLPWLDGPAGAATLAGLLLAGGVTVRILSTRRGWAGQGPGSDDGRRSVPVSTGGRVRRTSVVLIVVAVPTAAGCVALAVTAVGDSSAWPPAHWVMVAYDVGQGDALVLPAGDGQAVVVDAGPDPDLIDGCLRRLGVRHVPLLIITHLHADHVEGVPGVLDRRQVDEVVVGPYDEPAGEARRLAEWLGQAGVPVGQAHPGQSRRLGPLTVHVLGPQRVIIGEGSTPNNASLVVSAQIHGVRILLTGDVEPPAARMLVSSTAWPAVTPVDVLKVPHHGSAYQDPGLLTGSGARVALISVGADNDYGHPARSTLRALRSASVLVARTDQDGDVAVTGPADRLAVTRRTPAGATR